LESEKMADLGLCVAPPIGLELKTSGEISRTSPFFYMARAIGGNTAFAIVL
jgi:hypothetical protein